MREFFTFICLIIMATSMLMSCQGPPNCPELAGSWSNREGYGLVFKSNNKALWLNKFGQIMDTVSCVFVLNCKTNPATLDFSDFNAGPFQGKTLFGIIEWSADSLFRYCYEAGTQPDVRPQSFDQAQTMKFFRERY